MSYKPTHSHTAAHLRRAPGRPRLSSDQEVLDAAMRCFWARGYEASSIGWLTDQMGLPRASLYHRFGDKRGLFLASVEHYGITRTASVMANLSAEGDARAEITGFFDAMIDLVSGDPATRGCLVACVLSEAAGTDAQFREVLRHKFDLLERKILGCLKAQKDLRPCQTLPVTAAVLAATARGLALSARAGTPADTLRATAQMAITLTCPARPQS